MWDQANVTCQLANELVSRPDEPTAFKKTLTQSDAHTDEFLHAIIGLVRDNRAFVARGAGGSTEA